MLHIHGVKKGFHVGGSHIPILDIPQWKVSRGEKLAIIGPSGSGKSTLLHVISGILRADQGEVQIDGQLLHRMTESARDGFRASRIGYILQDFHLIPSLTARQNVEIVMPGKMGSAERRDRVDSWFERARLGDRSRHLPSQLSRGQQQRVAIIRADQRTPSRTGG